MATATLPRETAQPINGSDGVPSRLFRFTVARYQRLINSGVLHENDRCELVRGVIYDLMPPNPPHSFASSRLGLLVAPLAVAAGFVPRVQEPVILADSQPQPDLSVSTGPDTRYRSAHPRAGDVVLVVEVSDSAIRFDTGEKLAMYASAKVPVYWIVNLRDRMIEVYTNPRGGKSPNYRKSEFFTPGQSVPVVLVGQTVGTIPVNELLP